MTTRGPIPAAGHRGPQHRAHLQLPGRRGRPGARVAYVDHDPLVLEHARAAAAGHPGPAVVPGDLRQPDEILAHPELRRLIDPRSPVCLVLASVLHLLPPEAADAAVAGFRSVMTAGSYLIVLSGTSTGTSPAFIERLRRVYARTSDITGRPAAEIASWFAGLEPVPPDWPTCSCGLLIRVRPSRFPRPGCSGRWGGGRAGARPPGSGLEPGPAGRISREYGGRRSRGPWP